MGKTIDIPDNISKTQFVEEIFRHIKDNPENQQSANSISTAKKLARESHDVVNLTQIRPDDREEEDKTSSYRDDSSQSEQEQTEHNQENDSCDDEESNSAFNKLGKNLDIEV